MDAELEFLKTVKLINLVVPAHSMDEDYVKINAMTYFLINEYEKFLDRWDEFVSEPEVIRFLRNLEIIIKGRWLNTKSAVDETLKGYIKKIVKLTIGERLVN